MFCGSIPALVTPFREQRFDEAAFRALVDWQIDQGSSALVPCGTTGESATLSIEEHDQIISVCIEQTAGRVPVIAGCGSNDTAAALAHMRHAQDAGAQAALVVVPYYNNPNQDGIIAHFTFLAEKCDLPIIIYNVPARTIADIAVETLAQLSQIPTIVGVKDASGNVARASAQRLLCRPNFCQLSGNDDMALGFMAMGGQGCISVTANVAPRLCADFQAACLSDRWGRALELQDLLYPLHDALFSDASPGPTKYALSKVRPDMPSELRLPMMWPSEASQRAVDAALVHARITA